MRKKPPQKSGTHAERIRRERGAAPNELPESDLLTPAELLDALRDEVLSISKAAELRIRELTIIATDYAKGKTTPKEANRLFRRYSSRWDDAIGGLTSVEGMTDEQILKGMADIRKHLRETQATLDERLESGNKGRWR